MTLTINRILAKAGTPEGNFGFDLKLKGGLNLIRADNTCGKSTCAVSLIYALGLEGMLQAHHGIPMAAVLTHLLDFDGRLVPILESNISIEITGCSGQSATIQRGIKSIHDTHLIRVWHDHIISNSNSAVTPSDYFVRIEGSAQRDRGFHTWLKKFIGWNLPKVPGTSGGETDLYLESIISLFYVEQKKGWSGIQANTPNYYVKDVCRRSFEFFMDLSAPKSQWRREQIKLEISAIRERWKTNLNICDNIANDVGGIQIGITEIPSLIWPPTPNPTIVIRDGKEVITISDELKRCQIQFKHISSEIIPSINEASSQIESNISERTLLLTQLELNRTKLLGEISIERSYESSVIERIASLQEDLQKNKDTKRLQEMGSMFSVIGENVLCPTCSQPIPETLLPEAPLSPIMTIEETIEFISFNLDSFTSIESKISNSLEMKAKRLRNIDDALNAGREGVRRLTESLTLDGRLPSKEAIREQVLLEERCKKLIRSTNAFDIRLTEFNTLSKRYQELVNAQRLIPGQALPPADKRKLEFFAQSINSQLKAFGFSSFSPDLISISEDSYRPIQDSIEVGITLSASDMIRVIWAYTLGMFDVSKAFRTNHLGLVILDEPRQQSAKDISFKTLLRKSADLFSDGGQAIIFTSEPLASLESHLSGTSYNLLAYDGRIIKPLSS